MGRHGGLRTGCWSQQGRGGRPHKGAPWCGVPEPMQGEPPHLHRGASEHKVGKNSILVGGAAPKQQDVGANVG